ncbi:nucleotidyltransferase substrate binding protein [Paramaledivibacter caminithermalis]|jgi:nucleotidyltransferase substrate binding protein (TIGR01987 family)|uniref:Nucleotidyltransferase substrate binding protein, HI0074 family n=1 Tax=Paramaledivibacter caminithermalis (strain DSM 15212 / CIP 107654 / DViRD3) TaxID=1121301 RepID=A0A1M6P5J0_PARC5|nr:nucleotidyltransferase substrate binding protein [Paramaledivibacter caminithermalis]SHK03194.1 nucleotidyltransferase substrate binding protein, HI0074 family [Paramaledivibacter caminithermalis DSM 15212]
MSDYKQKFENYKNALNRLNEGIEKYDYTNDLLRDGLIQRFEFTFELAWKTLKAIFEDEGLIGLNSPKTVLREAFSAGIIVNEELWLSMLKDRNSTTHIYSEEIAKKICLNIEKKYSKALNSLMLEIQKRKF